MKNFAIGLLAAIAGLGMTAAVNAEELRLGDFQSPNHVVSMQGTQKWMKDVEELTGGKITFSHFPAQQAAKSAELLGAVKNGILDAALIGPIYNSDVLPLNSVVGLPGFYKSAEHGTAAIQEMVVGEGPLHDEFVDAGVVPVFAFVLPPYQVLSKEKRLGGPADWKGLQVRTSGGTQALVASSLGAAGVSIPGPEVYTGVETGRLDAVLFPLASVPGWNLQEVVKYISTNGSFGGYSFVLGVRKDLYDGLSQDVKDAMLKAGADAAANVAKAQDDSIGALLGEWTDQGIEVYQFTDEELAAINDAISSTRQDWLDRIGAKSPRAGETVEQYTQLTK